MIREPQRTLDVPPRYPESARNARLQGLVVLEASIEPTGCVRSVSVLQGHPELSREAIRAVAQWRYTPTLLDGEPVPVVMTVTVNFRFE